MAGKHKRENELHFQEERQGGGGCSLPWGAAGLPGKLAPFPLPQVAKRFPKTIPPQPARRKQIRLSRSKSILKSCQTQDSNPLTSSDIKPRVLSAGIRERANKEPHHARFFSHSCNSSCSVVFSPGICCSWSSVGSTVTWQGRGDKHSTVLPVQISENKGEGLAWDHSQGGPRGNLA